MIKASTASLRCTFAVSDQIACSPVIESGLFIMGALWQQFEVRVGHLSHISVRSQTFKNLNDF